MFEIDLANGIFIFCLAVGGGLLLLTVVLDDVIGGMFDALHIGIHVGGVALMPPLLGFVAMFASWFIKWQSQRVWPCEPS